MNPRFTDKYVEFEVGLLSDWLTYVEFATMKSIERIDEENPMMVVPVGPVLDKYPNNELMQTVQDEGYEYLVLEFVGTDPALVNDPMSVVSHFHKQAWDAITQPNLELFHLSVVDDGEFQSTAIYFSREERKGMVRHLLAQTADEINDDEYDVDILMQSYDDEDPDFLGDCHWNCHDLDMKFHFRTQVINPEAKKTVQ